MTNQYAILPVANSDRKIIIDAALYPILNRYSWYIQKDLYYGNQRPYTKVEEEGTYKHYTLARVITKAPKGLYPKHLNGNFLDCRRVNIELVDRKDKAGSPKPTLHFFSWPV